MEAFLASFFKNPTPLTGDSRGSDAVMHIGVKIRFPAVADIVKSTKVQAAMQADWDATLKDYCERGAWIIWQGSPAYDPSTGHRDDVNGYYVMKAWPMAIGAAVEDEPNADPRDVIDPGRPPADDSLNFVVAHYHLHPPLDPSQHRDPANFPVGPSPDHDVTIANDYQLPGIVRDFTDIGRTVVKDYLYGPSVRPNKDP